MKTGYPYDDTSPFTNEVLQKEIENLVEVGFSKNDAYTHLIKIKRFFDETWSIVDKNSHNSAWNFISNLSRPESCFRHLILASAYDSRWFDLVIEIADLHVLVSKLILEKV